MVDSVLYKTDTTLLNAKDSSFSKSQGAFGENCIRHDNLIKLYVSTKNTIDRKSAFKTYLVSVKQDHFPMAFNIYVKLTNQTQKDITLYFFAFVKHGDDNLDIFIPTGTSKIHLRSKDRSDQNVDIYVKANGTEINGRFLGRYGERHIQSKTDLQVFIIPERSLGLRYDQTFESVAQLKLKNKPSTYPISFSLLVVNHVLNPRTKYYAVAYITEGGVRRLIKQKPILVIDENKRRTNSEVTFNVIPSPLTFSFTIVRSKPGPFILQPDSSLLINFYEEDSDSTKLTFDLGEITILPETFELTISETSRFDSSKDYEISAHIVDEKNTTYMSTSRRIPLNDRRSIMTIPVIDRFFNVHVGLESLVNTNVNYIPGSTAHIFVTENPDMLIKPIFAKRIDSISTSFREFSFRVPIESIQNDRNYYIVMIIDFNGIIQHISKSLLIPSGQTPPHLFQLSTPSGNFVRCQIVDIDNRPAQWSSSSYATLMLIDDSVENSNNAIIQTWKVPLEKNFPISFEIQLDFTHLRANHIYRLQAAIETQHKFIEYEPAGRILVLNPYGGIINNVRIPVRNVKQFQEVHGTIYMNGISGPLPVNSEIVLQVEQVSTSSLWAIPTVFNETRFRVDGHYLPINFTIHLPLNRIDMNAVHHIVARYVVQNEAIISKSQAYAFVPNNNKPVVLLFSETPQMLITGEVKATNGSLVLPKGSLLHLYVTDSFNQTKPKLYSEVFLHSSPNDVYKFHMFINPNVIENKIPIYLHTDIIYGDKVIVSMPKSPLLEISSVGEWNINLMIDLPTLLIGKIVSIYDRNIMHGDFDAHVQIIDRNTSTIVHKVQLHSGSNFPINFRIELDNDLFTRYSTLQARALIKNCKGQIIFDADNAISIRKGLNVDLQLSVALFDLSKYF